jgi:HNH endonuclease
MEGFVASGIPGKTDIVAVIEEYKKKGPKRFGAKYKYRDSTKYDLIYEGHPYPPKAIYNVAWKRAKKQNDRDGNKSGLPGGEDVNKPLRALGFEVIEKADYEASLQEPDAGLDSKARRTIALRQGQPKFRSNLLKAYKQTCAITGCKQVEILDACHIQPYSNTKDYRYVNGILLRTDIHTLFDLNLIRIHPKTLKISVSDEIKEKGYKLLHGRRIHLPRQSTLHPNKELLKMRWEQH